MPMVSTLTMPSPAKHAPIASRCVACALLTKEEMTRAWFTDGSVHCAGTTQKWIAAVLQPHCGTTREGKSSQWAALWTVPMVIHFV